MSNERFFPIVEKPMTSDEANERLYQMMRERARQDAEFRQKYPFQGQTGGATGTQYSGVTGPSSPGKK